jgi:hypothetical protein
MEDMAMSDGGNGLLRGKAGGESAGPGRGDTDPANTDGQAPNVSPQEQAQYDRFVDNGYKLIYNGGKVAPGVLQGLQASEDPKMNLAHTAVGIVLHLHESARKSGTQISPDVLFHGGIEIVEDLANIARIARIHDYDQDELEGATYLALDMYREQATQRGLIDPEALKAEFNSVVEADRAGKIDELLPGISKYNPTEEEMADG